MLLAVYAAAEALFSIAWRQKYNRFNVVPTPHAPTHPLFNPRCVQGSTALETLSWIYFSQQKWQCEDGSGGLFNVCVCSCVCFPYIGSNCMLLFKLMLLCIMLKGCFLCVSHA